MSWQAGGCTASAPTGEPAGQGTAHDDSCTGGRSWFACACRWHACRFMVGGAELRPSSSHDAHAGLSVALACLLQGSCCAAKEDEAEKEDEDVPPPCRYTSADIKRVHGVDERIAGKQQLPRQAGRQAALWHPLGWGIGALQSPCLHRFVIFPLVPARSAVDDYLRGIGFYARFLERASSDDGSEEAAAEAAAAGSAGAAATN